MFKLCAARALLAVCNAVLWVLNGLYYVLRELVGFIVFLPFTATLLLEVVLSLLCVAGYIVYLLITFPFVVCYDKVVQLRRYVKHQDELDLESGVGGVAAAKRCNTQASPTIATPLISSIS